MASATAKTNAAADPKSASTPVQDTKATAALEEDDEFEDFPVEGMLLLISAFAVICWQTEQLPVTTANNGKQTGRKKRQRYQETIHIFGRRAGMMMTQARTSRHS